MKKKLFVLIAMFAMIFSLAAHAQDADAPAAAGAKGSVLSGVVMIGGAGTLEDWGDADALMGDTEVKARLAGGFGVGFAQYMSDSLALKVGLEFVGKGGKVEMDGMTSKTLMRHLEIPIGVLLDISNFQLGFALVPSIALTAKEKVDADGVESETDWEDEDWDMFRRFNLNPRITAGFAIPIGPVAIVPGLMWEMELLNDAKDEMADANVKIRYMNLMGTVGVQFGL